MRRVISSLLFSAGLVCFGTHSATATTINTTNFSTWQNFLSGSATEADFSPITYKNYNTSSGITLSSFTFTGPDGSNWALKGASFNGFMSLEGGSDASAAINVALPGAGENAVLLGLGSTGGAPITVDLSDGETFTLTGNGLIGLSISHPITWLTVETSSGSAVIDDFWYGTSSLAQDPAGSGSGSGNGDDVAPVPEGATLLLMSGGLLTLIGAHRRRRVPATATAV